MIEKLITVSAGRTAQPVHWHESLEVNLVLRGKATGILNNVEEQLQKGEIWVINRDVAHCIEHSSDDFLYVQLHLNTELFTPYIPGIWTVYFKCGTAERDAVSESLKAEIRAQIYNIVNLMEYEAAEAYRENAILYGGIEILNNLKLGFNIMGIKLRGKKDDEHFNRIWRIIDYIYDHCNRKLTLKEVAGNEYISESYLSKIMKEQTGETFEATVAYIRAECSIKYLLESEMSITDIAYECGFSAPRYYNAAFIKRYHCTPAQYRQKNKNVFIKEDEVTATSIIFKEGIDRDELLLLLAEYDHDTSLPWEVNRFQLNLDYDIRKSPQREWPYRIQCLSCRADELLLHENWEVLVRCMKALELQSIVLEERESTAVTEIIERNLTRAGLELTNETNHCVPFKELLLDDSVYTNTFYAQEILNGVQKPCIFMKNSLVFYRKGNDFKIVILNPDKEKEKQFVINFSGEKSNKPYFMKKELIPVFTKDERRQILGQVKQSGSLWARELMAPQKHVTVVESLKKQTLSESLKCGQVCLITLHEINGA